MKMKFGILAGAVGGIVLASTAMASPLESLSMELVHSGDQGDTYRLYANLEDGARIDAVYGNAQGDLEVSVDGGSMYHDPAGGPTSQAINSAFFQFVPSMEWDSYVSIGALYANGDPFGANNLNDIGIDWAAWEGGGDLVSNNGSWFVTPDDAQGGELNGQVFIGQFTVVGGIGDLVGQVNLQGKDADGNTWNAIGASWVPAPGALALLGLAGLAGRRRRR
jgi:MYXO-CTERM domain-containing protein